MSMGAVGITMREATAYTRSVAETQNNIGFWI